MQRALYVRCPRQPDVPLAPLEYLPFGIPSIEDKMVDVVGGIPVMREQRHDAGDVEQGTMANVIADLLHLHAEYQNIVFYERDSAVVSEFQSANQHGFGCVDDYR